MYKLMIFSSSLLFLSPLLQSCQPHHSKRHQPSSSPPKSKPSLALEWGQLNILHTTDTHGWLMGHLQAEEPEPNSSGDFGDFQSFVFRMKQEAEDKAVDLLVIDSGDLHDGNGLSDAEPLIHIGTPRGTTTSKFMARVPYDIMAIGNHELYDLQIAQDMHDNFAPIWNGSYLTSNVNITTSGLSLPLGSRYRKFKTAHGRKITAFGILFHFTGNAKGTVVQPPAQLVKEPWFLEAIKDLPDVFILAGHMGVRDNDWELVFNVIRHLHPKVPIVILGGHVHVRDCQQLDSRSMSLASGRYMETIGWMSLSGLDQPEGDVKFTRRYLDQNRLTYAFHAGSSFDTPEGLNTTHAIFEAAQDFNITSRLGVSPQSYFNYRVPFTANNSMSYLLTGPEGVLPMIIRNSSRPHPPLVAVNSGAIRFDIFQGDFTINDEFIVMPFKNRFMYIPNVPRSAAAQFIDALNDGGVALSRRSSSLNDQDVIIKDQDYHLGQDVEKIFLSHLRLQAHTQIYLSDQINGLERRNILPDTYGYVTHDSCPGLGDDTPHLALPVYDPPEYIGTGLPPHTTQVDIVFYDFITSFAVNALNKIQNTHTYTMEDAQPYVDILANQIFGKFAQEHWN